MIDRNIKNERQLHEEGRHCCHTPVTSAQSFPFLSKFSLPFALVCTQFVKGSYDQFDTNRTFISDGGIIDLAMLVSWLPPRNLRMGGFFQYSTTLNLQEKKDLGLSISIGSLSRGLMVDEKKNL